MDPDQALKEIREVIDRVKKWPDDDLALQLDKIMEMVEALDRWLSRGGFLPHAWNNARNLISYAFFYSLAEQSRTLNEQITRVQERNTTLVEQRRTLKELLKKTMWANNECRFCGKDYIPHPDPNYVHHRPNCPGHAALNLT